MTFIEAVKEVFDNNARITRRTWNSRSVYCSLIDARLCITGGVPLDGREPEKGHPWSITESDYYGDDWEILQD